MLTLWYYVDGRLAKLTARDEASAVQLLRQLHIDGHSLRTAKRPIDSGPKGYATTSAIVRR